MKINRQELVNALEMVKSGLAQKEMIEQSTSFAFLNGRIVTYNDEISISCPVKNLDIAGAIKAEELYKLLGKLTEEEIEIKCTKTELHIQSGKAKAGLRLQAEITLPLINTEELSEWKDVPDNLSTAMQFCLFSCSNDMSRPILTCIHLREDGLIESCDNIRMTRYSLGMAMPINDVLIPARIAEKLVRYTIKKVAESVGWIHFKMEDNTIFSCRTIEEKYFDLTSILQMEGQEINFPTKIKEILGRASVFSKKEFLVDEYVTVLLEDKKASIRAEGQSGWFEEKSNVRYSGAPISFQVNPVFLQEICEKLQTSYIAEDRLKFVGGNWEHVLSLTAGKGKKA